MELTITNATIESKTYDGTTTATVTSVTLSGDVDSMALGTDFTAAGTFDDANVGSGRSVTIIVTLGNTDKAENYTVSGNYTLNGGVAGNTATMPITVSTPNYLDFTINVVITLTDKDVPLISIDNISAVYGESLAIQGTATFDNNPVDGTWSFVTYTSTLVMGSNSATVKFTPTDDENYAEVTDVITVIISKATPTGAPKYTAIIPRGTPTQSATLRYGRLPPEQPKPPSAPTRH